MVWEADLSMRYGKLEKVLREKGYTYEKISKELGIENAKFVGRWFRDITQMRSDRFVRLCYMAGLYSVREGIYFDGMRDNLPEIECTGNTGELSYEQYRTLVSDPKYMMMIQKVKGVKTDRLTGVIRHNLRQDIPVDMEIIVSICRTMDVPPDWVVSWK